MDMEFESQNTVYCINEKYGLKIIKINNKFGVLNHENRILIPPVYSYIRFNIDGYILVSLNGKETLYTIYGKQLLPFKYDNISISHHGLIRVSSNGKWGILNRQFHVIVPTIYDHCIITDGFTTPILVKRNNKWGLVNRETGKLIVPTIYDRCITKDGFTTPILVKRNNKWGLVNSETGKLIAPTIYDNIGNTGVYDLFEFPDLPADDVRLKTPFFNCGLASVEINGKWGFIDTKGEIKIPPVWDWVDDLGFYTGVATVHRWEKGFYKNKVFKIDTNGKILCEIIELNANS